MGKERGSRHVSSPEGLFLCHLIAWARKVSFCLSPPELGISHLHPQASRLTATSTPKHHTPPPSLPTCSSVSKVATASHQGAQSGTASPSTSLPRPCPMGHHRKVSFGPLGGQGLVVFLRQVAYCMLHREAGRERQVATRPRGKENSQ